MSNFIKKANDLGNWRCMLERKQQDLKNLRDFIRSITNVYKKWKIYKKIEDIKAIFKQKLISVNIKLRLTSGKIKSFFLSIKEYNKMNQMHKIWKRELEKSMYKKHNKIRRCRCGKIMIKKKGYYKCGCGYNSKKPIKLHKKIKKEKNIFKKLKIKYLFWNLR